MDFAEERHAVTVHVSAKTIARFKARCGKKWRYGMSSALDAIAQGWEDSKETSSGD